MTSHLQQTEERGKNRRRVSSIRDTQGSSAERNCSKTLNTRSKLKLRRVDSPSIRVTVFGSSTHYVAEGRSPGRSFMTDLHPTAPCAFFAWQKFSQVIKIGPISMLRLTQITRYVFACSISDLKSAWRMNEGHVR